MDHELEDIKRRAGITEADVSTMSHWDEHPQYPVDDWKYEVANDDTRLGYLDWVKAGLMGDTAQSQG